ncbi:hypothetical protein QBC47DRAFT_130076 [Echria macrotheca]|uniref:Uncharacterized protein n=1 Tax=Echria macrotheca TaxID=438768 RepID=A0AAJ0B3N2_9PEZI|nr:hypothetical protein QBC47DRAFT_130076 [Echria macrotheca]
MVSGPRSSSVLDSLRTTKKHCCGVGALGPTPSYLPSWTFQPFPPLPPYPHQTRLLRCRMFSTHFPSVGLRRVTVFSILCAPRTPTEWTARNKPCHLRRLARVRCLCQSLSFRTTYTHHRQSASSDCQYLASQALPSFNIPYCRVPYEARNKHPPISLHGFPSFPVVVRPTSHSLHSDMSGGMRGSVLLYGCAVKGHLADDG